jgi:hypothetical protein
MSAAVMPRSLLVFLGEAYEQCLHGIDEVGIQADSLSIYLAPSADALQDFTCHAGQMTNHVISRSFSAWIMSVPAMLAGCADMLHFFASYCGHHRMLSRSM